MPQLSTKLQKMIGNFEIGKVIGTGTFGKVRQGRHISTGQKVAIKILQKKKIKSSKDIQRIQKQLEILKEINHPNILKLLQVKQTDKEIFIVTQLANGEELYDRIVKKGSLTVNQSCKYFIQLYQAIKFLHLKNISHRDIKPENIIVDGQNLKLIDFGLSTRWSQSKIMMQTPCGSPCYAAPEMVLGKKYDCRKVDVWAMGVTLYAMLMGKLPFQHENTQKLYRLIQNSQYQQVKGIPSQVSVLLRAMIQKDPKKRICINEIGQNIWIRDEIRQKSRVSILKSEWNQQVLNQMQKYYKIPVKNLITEMIRNSISQYSTYYHLKSKKMQNFNSGIQDDQIHDGPFHIQFVFKSFELLQSFLEKNNISYNWINNQKQCNVSSKKKIQIKGESIKRRYILINGEILRIKKLKNLPKLIYLPLKRQLVAKEQETQKKYTFDQYRERSHTNLNSSRSQITNICIQTF